VIELGFNLQLIHGVDLFQNVHVIVPIKMKSTVFLSSNATTYVIKDIYNIHVYTCTAVFHISIGQVTNVLNVITIEKQGIQSQGYSAAWNPDKSKG
jgi:hypothetical protein